MLMLDVSVMNHDESQLYFFLLIILSKRGVYSRCPSAQMFEVFEGTGLSKRPLSNQKTRFSALDA